MRARVTDGSHLFRLVDPFPKGDSLDARNMVDGYELLLW